MKQELLDEVYNDYVRDLKEIRGIEDEIISIKNILAEKKASVADIKKRIKVYVNIFKSYSTQFISFNGTYLTADMTLKCSNGDKEAKAFAREIGINYIPLEGQNEEENEEEKSKLTAEVEKIESFRNLIQNKRSE